MKVNQFSFGEFVWWTGVVENRTDPKKLGRLKVRIVGYHSPCCKDIPRKDLFWATVVQPITSAAISGVGTSPTGIVEGTWVVGFFMDGHEAQQPVIMGSIGGIPSEKDPGKGFNDPNGVYPKYPLGEQDTNRLARNEKISETIVAKKKGDLDTADIAFGGQWTERPTPYAAAYPFNHVRESESGHIEEFDDTGGAERYHIYHKKGSFKEIHPDGSQVNKVVKDNFEIVYGDDYVHVRGNCKVTVDGNADILVKGNLNLEVKGNKNEYIHGNYKLKVGGNVDILAIGHYFITSLRHIRLRAPRIDLN